MQTNFNPLIIVFLQYLYYLQAANHCLFLLLLKRTTDDCNFIADGNICDAKTDVIDNFVANHHMTTIKLTTQDFKDKVFNYEIEKEWKYKGTVPALIDFYADWCGPCKMVAPVLEELAAEYEGKLLIYKVDTETEMELAAAFGIQSIPTFLFIPVDADPMIQPGAFPKKIFKEIIDGQLLKKG